MDKLAIVSAHVAHHAYKIIYCKCNGLRGLPFASMHRVNLLLHATLKLSLVTWPDYLGFAEVGASHSARGGCLERAKVTIEVIGDILIWNWYAPEILAQEVAGSGWSALWGSCVFLGRCWHFRGRWIKKQRLMFWMLQFCHNLWVQQNLSQLTSISCFGLNNR